MLLVVLHGDQTLRNISHIVKPQSGFMSFKDKL